MNNINRRAIVLPYDRFINRIKIIEDTGCQGYEVLFPEDREASGFDSLNLFNSVSKMREADQKKVHLGMQWIFSFDGLHPIVIADYANANYSESPVKLTPMVEYAIDRYESFLNFVKEAFQKKNIEINILSDYFEVEEYACRVYSRELTTAFKKSRTDAEFVKVFGHSVALSPSILYTK